MTDLPPWLRDWMHTVTLWDLALWLAAAIALVALAKKGWPALKRFATRLSAFIRTVDAVAGLPEFIERTNRKIDEIHHEVNYNNGSSVKDAARRIEQGVAGLYRRVGGLDESLAGVHGRLDDVDRQLTELASADDEIRHDAEQLRADFEDTHPRPIETNGDKS